MKKKGTLFTTTFIRERGREGERKEEGEEKRNVIHHNKGKGKKGKRGKKGGTLFTITLIRIRRRERKRRERGGRKEERY